MYHSFLMLSRMTFGECFFSIGKDLCPCDCRVRTISSHEYGNRGIRRFFRQQIFRHRIFRHIFSDTKFSDNYILILVSKLLKLLSEKPPRPEGRMLAQTLPPLPNLFWRRVGGNCWKNSSQEGIISICI